MRSIGRRGGAQGTINDENYRKRLQDRFGNRWKVKMTVVKRTPEGGPSDADPVPDEPVEISAEPNDGVLNKRRRRKRSVKVVRDRTAAGTSVESVERDVRVDIPRYRFVHQDEFQIDWHLALWAPTDPDGPHVLINVDSPILEEVVKYHKEQYPDVYAEEVANIVREVFGEVAVAKVAHSQRLARRVPVEELDTDYRSEKALTIALMGLLAEEAVISTRLGKLGRKKFVG